MTLKIDIIKTGNGYNYRNADTRKLVGTIKEGRNKPGVFLWETFGDYGFVSGLEQAEHELKHTLSQRANDLGIYDIEYTNI